MGLIFHSVLNMIAMTSSLGNIKSSVDLSIEHSHLKKQMDALSHQNSLLINSHELTEEIVNKVDQNMKEMERLSQEYRDTGNRAIKDMSKGSIIGTCLYLLIVVMMTVSVCVSAYLTVAFLFVVMIMQIASCYYIVKHPRRVVFE